MINEGDLAPGEYSLVVGRATGNDAVALVFSFNRGDEEGPVSTTLYYSMEEAARLAMSIVTVANELKPVPKVVIPQGNGKPILPSA